MTRLSPRWTESCARLLPKCEFSWLITALASLLDRHPLTLQRPRRRRIQTKGSLRKPIRGRISIRSTEEARWIHGAIIDVDDGQNKGV